MEERIKEIVQEATGAIREATTLEEVEHCRITYLGRKGQLTQIFKEMGKVDKEEKKVIGPAANKAKNTLEQLIEEKKQGVQEQALHQRLQAETIDVTEPGTKMELGKKHPINLMIEKISGFFSDMGYSIADGPHVESVYNAFDALNSPENHPSRDKTDTFYISKDTVLRPHTSSVQIRTLLEEKPPIKVISPGRCFRCDTPDATHSPMFHQIEGLLVDENVTMADLKGTLDGLAKELFGEGTRTKFRPHHFPFTEPSAEMDVSCFQCGGSGCRICKDSGWIEILGCGMVHPNVLKVGGIDSEKYTGFAFGMGVERIAMLKYEIEDIRLFYENDMRFIQQFK